MTYTNLIERLKSDIALTPVSAIARESADAIEALQAECAEHKENAMRNARIAVSIRAERDQLQSRLDAMGKWEPVAYIQTQKGGEVELVWDKDEELEGALYEYAPLYSAPKALTPLTEKPFAFMRNDPICFGLVTCDEADEGAIAVYTRREA